MPWPGGEGIRWSPTFLECFNPQPLHSPVGGSTVTGQVTAPLLQASSCRQVHGGAPRAQPSPRHNQHGWQQATPSQQGVEGPAGQMWLPCRPHPETTTPKAPPRGLTHCPFSPARTNRKLPLPGMFLGDCRHVKVSRSVVCLQPSVLLRLTRLTRRYQSVRCACVRPCPYLALTLVYLSGGSLL